MQLKNFLKINKKKSNRVIITGSAGLVGNFLVKKLLKNNYKIISVDTRNPRIINKNHVFFKQRVEDFFKKKLSNIDAIIHLAAHSRNNQSMKNPDLYIRNNILSTLAILERIKNKKTLFFFAGSNQFENDKKKLFYSPYSLSKFSSEELVKFYGYKYNLRFCILKFSDIFSLFHYPKKKALSIFIRNLKKNKNIFINSKNDKFNFLSLELIVETILNFLKVKPKSSLIVRFKTSKISITKLIKLLKKKINSKSQIILKKNTTKLFFKKKIILIPKEFTFKNNLNSILQYV